MGSYTRIKDSSQKMSAAPFVGVSLKGVLMWGEREFVCALDLFPPTGSHKRDGLPHKCVCVVVTASS